MQKNILTKNNKVSILGVILEVGKTKECDTPACKEYVKSLKTGQGEYLKFKVDNLISQVIRGVYGTKHRSALLLQLEELKDVLN